MISNDLLVKNFELMNLLGEIIYLTLVHEVLGPFILLKSCLFISKLHNDPFELSPLGLNCRLKSIRLTSNLANFLIGQIDSPQYVRITRASCGVCN